MKYPLTPDGRHFVVNGRKWRMTDPATPKHLEKVLVAELMAARRAVAAAKRACDEGALRAARLRVHDAKTALGERGRAWWLPVEEQAAQDRFDAGARALMRQYEGSIPAPPDEAADASTPIDAHLGLMLALAFGRLPHPREQPGESD